MPHIDGYRFGRITIDGRDYTDDVILLGDEVLSPWWRERGGHVFHLGDMGRLLDAAPPVLVLGIGRYGRVRVPDETRRALEEAGTEVVVLRTADAVEEYNRRAGAGEGVSAALHLTC